MPHAVRSIAMVLVFAAFACGVSGLLWQYERYGTAEWRQDPSGAIRIVATEAPGGLYARLQPTTTGTSSRIHVRGRRLHGPATLRVTAGDREPRWLAAPDGDLTINLEGGPIELLVYADTAFEYELESLSFEPCPECLDDAGLRSIVSRDIDGLEQALATNPIEAAQLLLDWTASTADLGWGTADRGAILNALSAAQVLQDFWMPDAGGASCSGFAVFFHKLLALFGMRAFTIDIGYPGSSLTHVTTVLVLERGNSLQFHIMDPTFNGRYTTGDGLPADLEALLAALRNGRIGDYRFTTLPINRDVVFSPRDWPSLTPALRAVDYDASACTNPTAGPQPVCKGVPYALPFLLATWQPQIERLGLRTDRDLLLQLLSHRVISATGANAVELEAFRQLLVDHGIPYGMPASS